MMFAKIDSHIATAHETSFRAVAATPAKVDGETESPRLTVDRVAREEPAAAFSDALSDAIREVEPTSYAVDKAVESAEQFEARAVRSEARAQRYADKSQEIFDRGWRLAFDPAAAKRGHEYQELSDGHQKTASIQRLEAAEAWIAAAELLPEGSSLRAEYEARAADNMAHHERDKHPARGKSEMDIISKV